MSFEAVKKIYNQDLFAESATAKERIGTVRELEDGRRFVYAKAGASGLAVGKLMQARAIVADHTDMVVAATTAIGDKKVTATMNGSTAATLNQYKDGFMYVNDATGEGAMYKVKGNSAASGGGVVTIYLYDALRVALPVTTCQVSLITHPADGVIVTTDANPESTLVGVTIMGVTANYYCWLQTRGICPVLTEGTLVVGNSCIPASTAGSVGPNTIATDQATGTITVIVGNVVKVNATTEYSLVNLMLA